MTEVDRVSPETHANNQRLLPHYTRCADEASAGLVQRALSGQDLSAADLERVADMRRVAEQAFLGRNDDGTWNENLARFKLEVAAAFAGDERQDRATLKHEFAAQYHERTMARARASRDSLDHVVALVCAIAAADPAAAQEMAQRLLAHPIAARQAYRLAWLALAEYTGGNDAKSAGAALSVLRTEPSLARPWAPAPNLSQGQQWALLLQAASPPLYDPMTSLRAPIPSGIAELSLDVGTPALAHAALAKRLSRGMEHWRQRAMRNIDQGASEVVWQPYVDYLREHADTYRQRNLVAGDVATTIDLARRLFAAGTLDEATAWAWIRAAARTARAAYGSWGEYATALLLWTRMDFQNMTRADRTAAYYAKQPSSPWQQVPWDIDPGLL